MKAVLPILLLLAMLGVPQVSAAEPVAATGAHLEGDKARTRLVVELAGSAEPRVFTLADPYRVVIELPNVVFHVDDASHDARGLVSAFRYGLIAPGRSRIVIDTPAPVEVERTSTREEDGAIEFTLDLVPTSRAAFLRTVARQNKAADKPPARETPLPVDASDRRPLVVIDPGHGGIDTGAISASGEDEKNVVLAFGLALRQKLLASRRYRVVMTRDDDSFVALADRVRIARDQGAQLFVSIHADSLSDPFGVRGATVYTLSDKASDAEAARLAEKENRADVIAGVDLTEEPDEVAGILIDLARRETNVFSARFAQNLVRAVKDAVRMNKNPQRSAGFLVLKAPDVPSVLLELGYMSSKEDLKLLTSQQWRDTASEATVSAIDGFFKGNGTGGTASGMN